MPPKVYQPLPLIVPSGIILRPGETLEQRLKIACHAINSVKQGTERGYMGKCHRLFRNTGDVSWHAYMTFLAFDNPHADFGVSTMEGTFSAIRWYLGAFQIPTSANDEQWVRQCMRAYTNRFAEKMRGPDKGAITSDMLCDFMEYCVQHQVDDRVLHPLLFQWSGGFRGCDIRKMRRNNFVELADGRIFFISAKSKDIRMSYRHGRARTEQHTLIPALNDFVKGILISCSHEDQLLFPDYKAQEDNKIIKAASKHLDWPKDLLWSGHCMRHGPAVEIASRYGLSAARSVLGHDSERTTAYYARLNRERKTKACTSKPIAPIPGARVVLRQTVVDERPQTLVSVWGNRTRTKRDTSDARLSLAVTLGKRLIGHQHLTGESGVERHVTSSGERSSAGKKK